MTSSAGNDSNGDDPGGRARRLDRALRALLGQTPELEAAAVVSFDGLPMASALPVGMDEERVAAMSAALLSLGERAAEGLGRGELTQVYVEGEAGTVFLVSAEDEAVLVAVSSRGAKTGLVLFEARRTARAIAEILREENPVADPPELSPAVSPAAVPAQSRPVQSLAQVQAERVDRADAGEHIGIAPASPLRDVSALRVPRADTALAPVLAPDGWASWGSQGTHNNPAGIADPGAASPTTSR